MVLNDLVVVTAGSFSATFSVQFVQS